MEMEGKNDIPLIWKDVKVMSHPVMPVRIYMD